MTLRPLMVLGTSSHAGKSLLAAGFGRLFADRGLSVAPFKAQNMSLNSFVTPAGGEIARAQVTQAEACGVEPHTDMNPVLLKPASGGSHVILDGQPIGFVVTLDYYARRHEFWPRVTAAFDRLRGRFDLVVLEGAGSPVEMNLLDSDIVNLNVARHADAALVIVADIERGGVFAQIIGTWELLEPADRRRVVGFVVNKFRGERSLFDAGIEFIEARTGRPVLGVLPFDELMQLDQEDSLGVPRHWGNPDGPIDIAVVRLAGISNFTDFWPFGRVPGVRARFVSPDAAMHGDLRRADLVILPGTRTTAAAIEELRDCGIDEQLRRLLADPAGPLVLGICGGYQMLGRWVDDPDGVESDDPRAEGLGLLPVATAFSPRKTLHQVRGRFARGTPFGDVSGEVAGYEIHMGETLRGPGVRPLLELVRTTSGETILDGAIDRTGRVFGTYVHGLFDSTGIATQIVHVLRHRRGLPPLGPHDHRSHREFLAGRYCRLADFLREHLDLGPVFDAVGVSRAARPEPLHAGSTR